VSLASSTDVEPHPGASHGVAGSVSQRLIHNVQRVVRGRSDVVELVAAAMLAGGHVLLEDVPGSGKTTLARAFARSVGGSFGRVQGTPDLMPADITGSSMWNPTDHSFTFVPGPVFAHVVLVDEINRTPPRTQAAFLEVMDEGAVTVDGHRHPVPDPFFVLATQNPMEHHGTYPLPEGQLDRFALRLRLGELDVSSEVRVVREQLARPTVDDLTPVTSADELRAAQHEVRLLHVSDAVLDYAVTVTRATRQDPRVHLGASSRAAISLVRVAQARAVCQGRAYVTPDDVKAVAPAVLAHRLVMLPASVELDETVVSETLRRVAVPIGG
jgi:MoxR-like ATPase